MTTDWEEVKRLAADFQKAQLSSTLQRLSERNCIEIVTLLLEKKLLEVVFTNDGKEYITPGHLEREIQDELYDKGGRVNLTEVSKSLNMDLSRIEKIAEKISSENDRIHFILGQLIDDDYILMMAEEINEKLAHRGEISVNDLTTQLDLPSDFLQRDIIEKHLGKIIKARQDPTNPRIFFTQAYLQRCKAKMRGCLAAIKRPMNVSIITQQINVPIKLFFNLFDETNPDGHLTTRQANNAQYIPNIYTKMQTEWVQNFYRQNGFIEYESMQKLGITQPKQYLSKQFMTNNAVNDNSGTNQLVFLKRCAVSSKLIELTIIPALMATTQFIDLCTLLPSNMSASDREELFEVIMNMEQKTLCANNYVIVSDDANSVTVVFTREFLDTELLKPCREFAEKKAKMAVDNGSYQQYLTMINRQQQQLASNRSSKGVNMPMGGGGGGGQLDDGGRVDKREERRRKAAASAGGKTGGGAQGRETKSKSTKKHARGKKHQNDDEDDNDNDEGYQREYEMGDSNVRVQEWSGKRKQFELMTLKELQQELNKNTRTFGLEDLDENIAARYFERINTFGLNITKELYELSVQQKNQDNADEKSYSAVQEKINTLLVDIRLYEKGLKHFPPNIQVDLTKYLLKSIGNEICNELTAYIAQECHIDLKYGSNMNTDQRNKVAMECGGAYKSPFMELNKSLNKTSLDEFLLAVENALKSCSMIIKKVDKKKDRLVIVHHKEKLLEQLLQCREPSLILHLSVLIIFTLVTGTIVHASGKFVANILQFIKPSLNAENNLTLSKYHDLVIRLLRASSSSEPKKDAEISDITEELQSLEASIKQLAQNFEKLPQNKSDQ